MEVRVGLKQLDVMILHLLKQAFFAGFQWKYGVLVQQHQLQGRPHVGLSLAVQGHRGPRLPVRLLRLLDRAQQPRGHLRPALLGTSFCPMDILPIETIFKWTCSQIFRSLYQHKFLQFLPLPSLPRSWTSFITKSCSNARMGSRRNAFMLPRRLTLEF